jgi:alkanesulfonate monooxygenase SsuD/methylene tetrahydromethanopterin reductase-like flavin-dependent oxidoreductase (luciferase family)
MAIAQHAARRSVVGAPEQVRERLLRMVADYRADELIVVTITHDFKARMRSYELLAEAFELSGRPT